MDARQFQNRGGVVHHSVNARKLLQDLQPNACTQTQANFLSAPAYSYVIIWAADSSKGVGCIGSSHPVSRANSRLSVPICGHPSAWLSTS